jgi:hypothetical protein
VRRTVIGLGAWSVLLALPVWAAPASHRESRPYSTPGGVQGVINGSTNVEGNHFGFVQIPSRPTDRRVTVAVTDTTGLPVAFEVSQWDADASGGERVLGSFCSITPSLRLPSPGHSVVVYINAGSCAGMPSVPTTGTATATYR